MLSQLQRTQVTAAERHLDAVALDQLTKYLDTLDELTLDQLIESLLDTMPVLVDRMGDVSAALAADSYDLSREQSGVRAGYQAALAAGPVPDQVHGMVRWAITPLFTAPDAPRDGLRSRLEDATPRLVRQAGRDTTIENVAKDPARPRYMRVPRSGACGFCLMLSARGATYVSSSAASSVGRRKRSSSRASGSSYHDHCQCRPEPVWPGQSEPENVVALAEDFRTQTTGLSGKAAVRAYNRAVAARNKTTV